LGLDFSHGNLKCGAAWRDFLVQLAKSAELGYDAAKRRFRSGRRGRISDPLLELLNAQFDEEGRASLGDCGRIATRIREATADWNEQDAYWRGWEQFAARLADALDEAERAGEIFRMFWRSTHAIAPICP
jgi:hypothetical protein